jgi:hypothetical protein
VRDRIHSLDQAHHRGAVRELAGRHLLVLAGEAERLAVGDAKHVREGFQALAQHLAEAACGAGKQQALVSGSGGH